MDAEGARELVCDERDGLSVESAAVIPDERLEAFPTAEEDRRRFGS